MLQVQTFVFSYFQENTYLIWDETQQAVLIDPGCYSHSERQKVQDFIAQKGIALQAIWCTHGHIDHIFGVEFLAKAYNVPVYSHEIAWDEMQRSVQYSGVYGTPISSVIKPTHFVKEGDVLHFGNQSFEVLFTPGDSPGSISFYHRAEEKIFAGDVLFEAGIGRWDLPGGNYEILMQTIVKKLLPLPDSTTVYPGHFDTTQIGKEKQHNSYILTYLQEN